MNDDYMDNAIYSDNSYGRIEYDIPLRRIEDNELYCGMDDDEFYRRIEKDDFCGMCVDDLYQRI